MGSIGSASRTLLDMYKNINPNYAINADNLDSKGYNNNCVQCALAFEANMRGQDVEANPFIFGDRDTLDRSRNVENAFNNVDVWDVGRNRRDLVVKEINDSMHDFGNGSRAILQVVDARVRHTMNVINSDGKVIVVDAQQGKQGTVDTMLKGLPTKSVKLFRTDNQTIKDEYKKWAYRRR